MEEAKKLLLQTDYKSQTIGAMVGYPEPNYFSYVFKKNCGISPVNTENLHSQIHRSAIIYKELKMKNKKISIRIIFPVVMSASIAACIISCILLFSYYFFNIFSEGCHRKNRKAKGFSGAESGNTD